MSDELPEGWASTKLGAVIRGFEAGRNLRCQGRAAKDGEFGVLKISAVTWGTFRPEENKALLEGDAPKPHERIQNNDLLITRANTSDLVGAVVLVRSAHPNLMLPDKILRLQPLTAAVDPRFLLQALRTPSVREHFAASATGTSDSMRNLSQPKIAAAPIRIAPLPEQHRIVEKVEALLEQVNRAKERLDRVPLILKSFRQAVLAAACSGKLTNPDVDDDSIPNTWRRTSLDDLLPPGGLFDGPFGSSLKTSDYCAEGVRVIRLENVQQLRFVPEKETFISHKKYESLRKHTVGEGDIIFGSFVDETVRVCVLPRLVTPAIAKADCFCIRPRTDLVTKEYLAFQLACHRTRNALVEDIHGATRPRINTTQLRAVEIPLCPIEEQKEIGRQVQRLFTIADAIQLRLQTATACANKLPQAILSKAFSGELVPTEAELARLEGRTYETAEELLKRVTALGSDAPVAGTSRGRRARKAE